MKPKHSPVSKVFYACKYSMDGLITAFKSELAFKQELFLFFVLLPLLYYLPISPLFKLLLFAANTLILIAELINTAIEVVVDMVQPDYDLRAKKAKDLGSAAVFLSFIICGSLWGYALFSVYFM